MFLLLSLSLCYITLQCCVYPELSLATTISVEVTGSCYYMISFNYGAKKARDIGFTCSGSHLSNIMPDSIFYNSMGWAGDITEICIWTSVLT